MKVVLISSVTPSGHYTQYLSHALNSQQNLYLTVYAGLHEKTSLKHSGRIKRVWHKSPQFIIDILNELKKDKPDIVHLQQEFNMYGGSTTAILFPVLILLIRLSGFKTVVTVHAAVYKAQVNKKFVWLFNGKSYMKPFLLKLFFHYIYMCTGFFSHKVIAHTERKLNILTHDYSVNPNKITIIPAIIPRRKPASLSRKPYFFYFGYMVRRKGIEELLVGFNSFIQKYPKPFYRLVMAGGTIRGQENALREIMDIIKKYGLTDRVTTVGFIEEAQQHKLYAESIAVVIPSLVSFGYSGPLYHAFSYRKPVLASNEGYFKEIIKDLENGILVKKGGWSSSLRLITKNKTLRTSIEKNILMQNSVQSPSHVAKQYLKLYKSL